MAFIAYRTRNSRLQWGVSASESATKHKFASSSVCGYSEKPADPSTSGHLCSVSKFLELRCYIRLLLLLSLRNQENHNYFNTETRKITEIRLCECYNLLIKKYKLLKLDRNSALAPSLHRAASRIGMHSKVHANVTRNMQHVTCNMSHATCNMSHATCHTKLNTF